MSTAFRSPLSVNSNSNNSHSYETPTSSLSNADLNESLVGDLPSDSTSAHLQSKRSVNSSHARKLRESFNEWTGGFGEENNRELANKQQENHRKQPRQSMPADQRVKPQAINSQTINILTPSKTHRPQQQQPRTPKISENSNGRNDTGSRRQTFAPNSSNSTCGASFQLPDDASSSSNVSRSVYVHVCRMLAESHSRINELDSNLKLAATIGETLINENSRLENVTIELEKALESSKSAEATLKSQFEALKKTNLTMIDEQLQNQLNRENDSDNHHNSSGTSGSGVSTESTDFARQLSHERRHFEFRYKNLELKMNSKDEEISELQDRINSLIKENSEFLHLNKRIKELESENSRLSDSISEKEFSIAGELKNRIAAARRAAELVNEQLKQELNEELDENNRKNETIRFLNQEIENLKFRIENNEKQQKQAKEEEFEEISIGQSNRVSQLNISIEEEDNSISTSSLHRSSLVPSSSSHFAVSSCSPPVTHFSSLKIELEGEEFTDPPIASPIKIETNPSQQDSQSTDGIIVRRSMKSDSDNNRNPGFHSNPSFASSSAAGSGSSVASMAISLAWSVIDPEFHLLPADEAKLSEVFELLSHQWRIALLLIESNSNGRENSWIPDNATKDCMNCHKPFSTFLRKHHCRLCGGLVCADCSAHEVDLPKFNFTAVRVCNLCFAVVRTMDLQFDTEQGIIIDSTKAPQFPVLCGPNAVSEIYQTTANYNNSIRNNRLTDGGESTGRKQLTE